MDVLPFLHLILELAMVNLIDFELD